MPTPTLLGYLARFGSFSRQSEVLCTQGLGYLLREHEDARSALGKEVEARTGVLIDNSLTWKAEVVQDDKGRVDLEAFRSDGTPVVKIEAKLSAELIRDQLQSYEADLIKRNSGTAALLVLVPKARVAEATRVTAGAFNLSGASPWRVIDGRRTGIAVISWEDLFTTLQAGNNERFLYELEQEQAMYRELSGQYIAPLASIEDLRLRPDRETDFRSLVDQATQRLTKHHQVLPLGSEPVGQSELTEEVFRQSEQKDYQRRYVSPLASHPKSYYSIGVRHPFAGWITPFWMRFHKDTGDFRAIRQNIEASSLQRRLSGGHIWIPLEIPLDSSVEQMVQALIDQAEEIVKVAYRVE